MVNSQEFKIGQKECHYRPHTEYGEGNVFIGVCHSVQQGGGCIQDPPPPPKKTDGQQAVGTHPTGMHTCLYLCFLSTIASQQQTANTSIITNSYLKELRIL